MADKNDEYTDPRTSTIDRRPLDGGVEVCLIDDRILIAVETDGQRQHIVCTEYNARRVLGMLAVLLGLPLRPAAAKKIAL